MVRRTILCNSDRAFVLYRIGVRFGLPVLAEWSEWFSQELEQRKAIEPLIGIGCAPALVKGTKKRFLGWIGHALKRRAIRIPEDGQTLLWQASVGFSVDLEERENRRQHEPRAVCQYLRRSLGEVRADNQEFGEFRPVHDS